MLMIKYYLIVFPVARSHNGWAIQYYKVTIQATTAIYMIGVGNNYYQNRYQSFSIKGTRYSFHKIDEGFKG